MRILFHWHLFTGEQFFFFTFLVKNYFFWVVIFLFPMKCTKWRLLFFCGYHLAGRNTSERVFNSRGLVSVRRWKVAASAVEPRGVVAVYFWGRRPQPPRPLPPALRRLTSLHQTNSTLSRWWGHFFQAVGRKISQPLSTTTAATATTVCFLDILFFTVALAPNTNYQDLDLDFISPSCVLSLSPPFFLSLFLFAANENQNERWKKQVNHKNSELILVIVWKKRIFLPTNSLFFRRYQIERKIFQSKRCFVQHSWFVFFWIWYLRKNSDFPSQRFWEKIHFRGTFFMLKITRNVKKKETTKLESNGI